MDNTVINPKPSIFRRFIDFLKRLFGRKEYQYVEIISRFKIILDEINDDTPEYDLAYNTVMLCEEAIRVTKQRILHAEKIKALNEKIAEVESFDKMTEEESKRLQNLLSHFISLSKERSALMHQITGFDNSLSHMMKVEGDASYSVDNINEAEEHRRILRQDLGYLGGEKAELEYEREFLEKGQEFIRRFSIFMVSVFAIVTVIFAFLYLFRDMAILMPMSIMTILLVLVIFILYIFRRRLNYELKMNYKKQMRAVELLNKKTAVFAHYTNYLNFVYKKYRVRNSQMLRKNLKDIESYKHLTGRLDNIRSIMYQTEEQIEIFLREKGINHLSTSVEHFAQTINVEDKKQYFLDLSKERTVLDKALTDLDNRHEEIWDLLLELSRGDTTKDKVVDRVIKTYLEEVEKIFAVQSYTLAAKK
ncbi:MAG: hypothetical protein LBS21_05740 [Clostridiales bacterium]|jgi:ABC-type multidrug transport system fused ATPase/permease subunit|nr:hypothetical protein [Clostridiales bacterium]